jgi:hypothetical protein
LVNLSGLFSERLCMAKRFHFILFIRVAKFCFIGSTISLQFVAHGDVHVHLFELQGAAVSSHSFPGVQTHDVKPGMYVIKVSGEKRVWMRKLFIKKVILLNKKRPVSFTVQDALFYTR